jgi:hypothetical protein
MGEEEDGTAEVMGEADEVAIVEDEATPWRDRGGRWVVYASEAEARAVALRMRPVGTGSVGRIVCERSLETGLRWERRGEEGW